jgi:hypothetical protein
MYVSSILEKIIEMLKELLPSEAQNYRILRISS